MSWTLLLTCLPLQASPVPPPAAVEETVLVTDEETDAVVVDDEEAGSSDDVDAAVIIVDEEAGSSDDVDAAVIIVDEEAGRSDDADAVVIVESSPDAAVDADALIIIDEGSEQLEVPSTEPPLPAPRLLLRHELSSRLLTDLRRQPTGEDVLEWWNRGGLRLEVSYGSALGAVVEGWARWGVTGEDPAPDHDYWLFNVRDGKWLGEVELREAFVRWRAGPVELRCGNQFFVWGKNELFTGADVLNPVDLRFDPSTFLGAPKEAKVPVLALSGNLTAGDAGVEIVVAPFFSTHRLSLSGRDFALAPPGSAEAAELAAVGAVHPSVEDQLQGAVTGTELPDESPLNASLALRTSLRVLGWDLAGTVYYGWDRTPRLRLDEDLTVLLAQAEAIVANPELLLTDPVLRDAALGVQQKTLVGEELLRARHRRLWRLALEAQGVVGDLVLRADVGFSPVQTFYDAAGKPRGLPAWTAAVGAEWTRGETWYVALTGYGLWALGAPRSAVLVGLERETRVAAERENAALYGVNLTARWRWEDEGVQLQAFGAYDLEPGDHLIAFELLYDQLAPHLLRGGVSLTDGPAGTLGRRYARNDFAYLGYALVW